MKLAQYMAIDGHGGKHIKSAGEEQSMTERLRQIIKEAINKNKKKIPFKNLDNLMSKILSILPNAQFDEDNDGQIVIYTNLQQGKDGSLLELE